MLATKELNEIKHYVLRQLPRVLEQDPDFVVFIEGIVSEKFPRRDEFARLLDELTALRTGQETGFKKADEHFEQVDQHLEQVDQHLVQLDQRFEQVDQHLEQVDQHLVQVDQHLEQVDQHMKQVDQHMEQVDQHMVQLDQRFEQVDQRLSGLSQDMRDLRDWVELIAGRVQNRAGRQLEDIVAGALRLGLQRPDVSPDKIRMRQKIHDPTGLVYKPGKSKEVDLVVPDGELLVFEVKSAPDPDDVDTFADKVELVRLQNPDRIVSGVFVAVGAEPDVRERCVAHGIRLIP
ncbi:MAG: hypothetical protein HY784_06370 [Chloroflexi bacterium]|nr:hypothetical protein [Chloroflexota bacterium]